MSAFTPKARASVVSIVRTISTVSVVSIASVVGVSPFVGAPTASAQSTKTVPVKSGSPAPSCVPGQVTTVAAMNNTRYGAAINVYEKASPTSQLKYSLGVGLEIKGAVVLRW